MFPVNEPESRLVCIQAIHWLLRNELLPRLTVDNHETVTNRKLQKCVRKKHFHRLLELLALLFSSLFVPQTLSTLLSFLALEIADEEGIDQIQYSSSNSWNNS